MPGPARLPVQAGSFGLGCGGFLHRAAIHVRLRENAGTRHPINLSFQVKGSRSAAR